MTKRSVILGLLGAAFICAFSYFNDNVLLQTLFIGNNMPASIYGGLILFILLFNPLLRKWKREYSLTGKELAVVLTLILAAGAIPGAGLLRTFTTSLIMPNHFERIEPGWREQNALDAVPDKMLVDPSADESVILNGFIQGLSTGNEHISPGKVPWSAWIRPISFWIPIVVTLWTALIALGIVVHRQWVSHEQLPYPIATFANALLPGKGQAKGSIFYSRLFWIGTGVVFLINFNNYLGKWFPEYFISVPTSLNFVPLKTLFPTLIAGGGERMLMPVFYMLPIGLSYFLASDVSFSLAIGPILWFFSVGFFAAYGISLTGSLEGANFYTSLKMHSFLLFGAYLGVFLSFLYTGRNYYLNVARRAFGVNVGDKIETQAVWGFRFFLLFMTIFVLQLTLLAGLELQLAIFYSIGLVFIFTVMSRIIAETGLFYIQPFFFPCVVIWGVFGAKALGPTQMALMFLLTGILCIDARESLMPFMVNSYKILDSHNIKIGKVAVWCVIAIILGIAIGLPTTLWFQYDMGHSRWDAWASNMVPRMPFENIVKVQQRLEGQDALEVAESVSGLGRYALMSPNKLCMISLLVGLVLVLLLTAGRLRFSKWPLHPIIFLTWSTEPLFRMSGAFMLGWGIKILVVKYGGRGAYQKLKPFMFGIIAGEIMGGIVPMIIGFVYYIITGEQPVAYSVLPS